MQGDTVFDDLPPEDHFEETISIATPITGETKPIEPSVPLYRARLPYSHETFIAMYDKSIPLSAGMMVVVPTRYGKDLAQIIGPITNTGNYTTAEVVQIDRLAQVRDIQKAEQDKEKEKEAYRICKEKIVAHNLEMKLVAVHYLLEDSKILFFFTAENRVDFRELVKDLVGIFKTRIELRQIGVRDESRVIGGLGVCGRSYCCHSVSDKLKPVSIKMAKDQNISLNSMKISGPCGRLLCCLAYEYGFYNEQRRQMPQEGCKVSYQGSIWKVTEVNPIAETIKLTADDGRLIQLPLQVFEKVENRWNIKGEPVA